MITLSIPTYNRIDFLFESFSNVISSEVISEVCIVDDFSDIQVYNEVYNRIEKIKIDNKYFNKIKIHRNEKNLGSFLNKLECVKKSSNDWIILLDSDNIINLDYVDIVSKLADEKKIYAPSHAICDSQLLNYTNHSGKIINKDEYKNILKGTDIVWDCIFNTGNYFFNRKNYLKCIEEEESIENSFASDAYYLIYLWFKNLDDSKFEIVKDLKYIHRLHNDSHYIKTSGSFNFLNRIKSRVNLWN